MFKRILILMTIIFANSFYASAQSVGESTSQKINLFYEQDLIRSHFSLGFESVTVSSGNASIIGIGPRCGFEYGVTPNISLGSNIVFSIQGTGAVGSYFYSGISGGIRYSLKGSSIKATDKVYQLGRSPVYTGKVLAQRRITLNLALEQLFLNGSTSIYPAVGATTGASWGLVFMGYEVEFEGRVSRLMANDNPLSMMGIGATINLDFM